MRQALQVKSCREARLTTCAWYAMCVYWICSGGDPTPESNMNYWTPERCKTIPTLVLMDNSLEISAQGAVSKNPSIRKRNAEIVEMIQAELRSRF